MQLNKTQLALCPHVFLIEELAVSARNGMRPVHPGEILGEELRELGVSATALAKKLGVPTNRVTAILNGQRGITADTALRLARYFSTTPRLWLNLQQAYEIQVAEIDAGQDIKEQAQPRDMSKNGGVESPDP